MKKSNLTLFGKHPAWSDHMYLAAEEGDSSRLKRIFYDHAMIPALQGADDSSHIPDSWNILAFVEKHQYYIVSIPSLDSVGRTRFPLFAAYLLPANIDLTNFSSGLKVLNAELRSLLQELLVVPNEDDHEVWQESVVGKLGDFSSAVDWECDSVAPEPEIETKLLSSLLAHVSEERNSLDLESCGFRESVGLALAAERQFRIAPVVVLVLDSKFSGEALLIENEQDHELRIEQFLKGRLPRFRLPDDRVPERVTKLLKPADYDTYPLSDIPGLRMGSMAGQTGILPVNKKHILIAAILALIGAVVIGLIVAGSGTNPDKEAMDDEVDVRESFPAREEWIRNASDYVEWIQPLKDYVASKPEMFAEQPRLIAALKLEHNPFSVVNKGEVRIDFVKNPTNRIFRQGNLDKLEEIYSNIKELRLALTEFFEKSNGSAQIKSIKDARYKLPGYLSHLGDNEVLMAPAFGEGFSVGLQKFLRDRASVKEISSAIHATESKIIQPIEAVFPEHAKIVRQHLIRIIAQTEQPKDFKAESDVLFQSLNFSDFPDLSDIDVRSLASDKAWKDIIDQAPSNESIQALVGLLQDYVIVESPEFDNLLSALLTAEIGLQNQLNLVLTDFPSLDVDQEAIELKQAEASTVIDEVKSAKRITRAFVTLSDRVELLLKEISGLEDVLKLKHRQSADPSHWFQVLDEEFVSFETEVIIEWASKYLGGLRSEIVADDNLDAVKGYQKFRSEAEILLEVCKLVDTGFSDQKSDLFLKYLENPAGRRLMQSYISNRLNSDPAKLENISSAKQEMLNVRDSIEKELKHLSTDSKKLERFYASMDAEMISPKELRRAMGTHVKLPLYLDNSFSARLSLLESAVSGAVDPSDAPEDLYWALQTAIDENRLSMELLAAATKSFASLDIAGKESVLSNTMRRAFDLTVADIRSANSAGLLLLYKNLNQYLPADLQNGKDKDFAEIAEYWSKFSENPEASVPAETNLRQMLDRAQSNTMKQFYRDMIEFRNKADELAGNAGLQKMVDGSKLIKAVEYDRKNSIINVSMRGDAGELSFLAVEVDSGVIFVLNHPLSLHQYVRLSQLADFGVDLFSQDSLWPRSYAVGVNGGFTSLGAWQFMGKVPFSALEGFSQVDIPAHINEPNVLLDLARMCGFRFFNRKEISHFLALASVQPRASIQFSSEDRKLFDKYKTKDHSVYHKQIYDSQGGRSWNGGLDFQRGNVSEKKFADILGGSAELVFEDGNFYAFGGSWLHMPTSPDMAVPIEDPDRTYIDLGVRFVFDAPAPTYVELIEQVGMKLMLD